MSESSVSVDVIVYCCIYKYQNTGYETNCCDHNNNNSDNCKVIHISLLSSVVLVISLKFCFPFIATTHLNSVTPEVDASEMVVKVIISRAIYPFTVRFLHVLHAHVHIFIHKRARICVTRVCVCVCVCVCVRVCVFECVCQ